MTAKPEFPVLTPQQDLEDQLAQKEYAIIQWQYALSLAKTDIERALIQQKIADVIKAHNELRLRS